MIRKHYVGAKEKVEEESEKVLVPSKGYSVPEDIGAVSNQQLQACRNCGRKFASDRVAKHEKVCQGEKLQKPKQEAV